MMPALSSPSPLPSTAGMPVASASSATTTSAPMAAAAASTPPIASADAAARPGAVPPPPPPRAGRTAPAPRKWRPLRFALVTLATALTLAATVSLGRWQLSRAAQKIALQAEIEAQKLRPPLDQDEFLALGDPASVLHRPVRLRGLWLAPQTVYLDNRQMHGLTGFYVLTPFALEGSERTVLVQRGWIPRNFNDRTQLAPVETPSGLVEITALVAPPPGRLLDLGRAQTPAPAPWPTASDASSPEAWAAAAANAASDAVASVVATMAPSDAASAAESVIVVPAAPVASVTPLRTVPPVGDAAETANRPGPGEGAATDVAPEATGNATDAATGKGAAPLSSAARNAAAAAAITAARDRAVGSSPIRQNLDLSAYRAETRLPLRTDLTLQQAGAASEGLLRDWPAPALGVEKHHGYAFQWFGLAGLVVLLYVWFQLIAPWRRSRRQRRG